MKIVPVPPEDYGIFYNGDAYIIYACSEYGKHGGMNMEGWSFYTWYKIKMLIEMQINIQGLIKFGN